MAKQPITPNNAFQHKRQVKRNQKPTQLQTIFEYLWDHVATASMVSKATGVPQKNICRYKRDLELAGWLLEVEKKRCEQTGFLAWYLTTDPNRSITDSSQLKLF